MPTAMTPSEFADWELRQLIRFTLLDVQLPEQRCDWRGMLQGNPVVPPLNMPRSSLRYVAAASRRAQRERFVTR